MATIPTPNQNLSNGPTDWVGLSKIVAIELVFVTSVAALLFGRLPPDVVPDALGLAVSTGATLGVLRITDVIANILNVRSFLASPTTQAAGVVPVAPGTALVNAPAVQPTTATGG